MRLSLGTLCCTIALAFLLACQAPAPQATMSVEEASAQIDVLRTAWVEAAENDDAAGCAALYTQDAVFVTLAGDVLRGREAIQVYLTESFATTSNTAVSPIEFSASGDVAYELGGWNQDFTTPEGEMMAAAGYYAAVSERQPDGEWMIRYHLAMMPPPEEVPSEM
jgi:uncharacterized protein (TIGR02246 family)